MKILAWRYVALFLCGMGLAHAQCDHAQVSETGVSGALMVLIEYIMKKPSDVPCNSLTTVLNKLASRGRTGGRKLEEDKPLDLQKAQSNLQEAMNDIEIRDRIQKIRSETEDENARLVYEAAILDEEGYYDARELRIQQLQQRLR